MMSTAPSSPAPAQPPETAASRLVLAVDTSSPTSSYAISNGETTLASLTSGSKTPHSHTFYEHLAILLKLAGCKLGDIDAFAAATGPGSFTGLRVGLAAIKGLAHTTGRPAIGVNSIDALALAAGMAGLVLVLINAGRKEVYIGLRLITSFGSTESRGEDRVGVVSELLSEMSQIRPALVTGQPLLIIGDGALNYQDALAAYAKEQQSRLRLVSRFDQQCAAWQLKTSVPGTAVEISRYAGMLLGDGRAPGVQPHYIRPSDAEIKWVNGTL